jgi:hypothetical protein
MSHYAFREKVFKNLNMSTEGTDANPIQTDVKKYLNKLKEPASVFIHQNVLSIVPNSQRKRYDSRIELSEKYCPVIVLDDISEFDIEELKEKVREESKSQNKQVPPISEGIFGDDDFYVSNQLLNNGPSTSKAASKRKSSSSVEVSSLRSKVPRSSYQPVYTDETSQGVYDDEALDTAGESSSDCPSKLSVKPVKRKKTRTPKKSKKAIVVSTSCHR